MVKCDTCLNSCPVISENGMHKVCRFSPKKVSDCIIGNKEYYIGMPNNTKEIGEKEEMKEICPFCRLMLVQGDFEFGDDFIDSDDNLCACVRFYKGKNPVLHIEITSFDDGVEYCDYDGNVPINYCPICGRKIFADYKKEEEG